MCVFDMEINGMIDEKTLIDLWNGDNVMMRVNRCDVYLNNPLLQISWVYFILCHLKIVCFVGI